MKQQIKNGIIFGISASITMLLVGASYAVWTGLIAESGDSLNVAKWNELVNKVETLETNLGSGSLGVGQTWQDVTSIRSSGGDYINSTLKPIYVKIYTSNTVNVSSLSIDGVTVDYTNPQYSDIDSLSAIIPVGAHYSAILGSTLVSWKELR